MDWYEKFEKVKELIGSEKLLTEVENYFNTDQLEEFINDIITAYDLEKEVN